MEGTASRDYLKKKQNASVILKVWRQNRFVISTTRNTTAIPRYGFGPIFELMQQAATHDPRIGIGLKSPEGTDSGNPNGTFDEGPQSRPRKQFMNEFNHKDATAPQAVTKFRMGRRSKPPMPATTAVSYIQGLAEWPLTHRTVRRAYLSALENGTLPDARWRKLLLNLLSKGSPAQAVRTLGVGMTAKLVRGRMPIR
jgi:hypothetical protein